VVFLTFRILWPCLVLGTAWASVTTDPVRELWESYTRNPDRHPQIPNNSYAGYRYGEEAPPDLPVSVRVTDFGANGTDTEDDTAAFKKALAEAGPKGGAVLVPAGTYHLSEPLFIHHSGQVLRGEGPDRSILHFTKPLEQAYGRNYSGSKSRWSWSGGLVWIAPPEVRPLQFIGQDQWTEGWNPGTELSPVTTAAVRGDTKIAVAHPSSFQPGMRVVLTVTEPGDASFLSHLSGDVPGTRSYDWNVKAAALLRNPQWHWPVEITRVEGNILHLRQPLRTDLRPAWKPVIRAMSAHIRNSGVENLTIRMQPTRLSPHLLNPGWNGIYIENAWDCWVRDVVVQDTDNGIGTAAAKCVTFDRFTITGRDIHHATYCREQSHDTLWTRFTVNNRWIHHGLNVENLSSGHVWSSGTMTHGTFDSHRALPFDAIRTDIRISNQGSQGGGNDVGPLFGARFAHWNVEILNGRAHMVNAPNMMPSGAVVGVRGSPVEPKPYPDFQGDLQTVLIPSTGPVSPPNLHLAQLEFRTGKIPDHLLPPLELQLTRTSPAFIQLDWSDPVLAPRAYEVSRRSGNGDWENPIKIAPGLRTHRDTDLTPGTTYSYRVRPNGGSEASWSPLRTIKNIPHPISGLAWKDEKATLALYWDTPLETDGTVIIERTPDQDPPAWQIVGSGVAITQTSWTDTSAPPGTRFRYRVSIENNSGRSKPVEIEAYTRAAGTTRLAEGFATTEETAPPWKGSWATWNWTGQARDKQPSIRPGGSPLGPAAPDGELAWPSTAQNARSFFHTTDIRGDFSRTGAEVRFDCQVGRSGPSAHSIALCLRLADGSWIATKTFYTETLMKWHHMAFILDRQKWHRFDAEAVQIGQPLPTPPDLSEVTGFGLYITRPINNRSIQIDNLEIWAVGLKGNEEVFSR
jgi:hypothetical protein